MDRRDFLKTMALAAGAVALQPTEALAMMEEPTEGNSNRRKSDEPLINSKPMLQNYAETSMGIAFSVSDLANGFVVYGKQPDLSDGRKVWCGGYRVTDMNQDVMLVRLTGLQPATTYYYRIGADRIHYGGGYDMKVLETVEDDTIYCFTTAGKDAKGHFCVINDTHARWKAFGLVTDKVAELQPACVIWNGDASNAEETIEDQKRIFLYPPVSQQDYASRIPYLFTPGNHDSRGRANRHLERVWMYRQPEERKSRDWDLGRNFAVRMGDIALIGLDTAEDKLDTNPLFANLFNSHAYREAQVAWLADALKRPEIRKAPFKVALCHIPLYDANPKANPGDVAPADKAPQYTHDFAIWQRTCKNLWSPLLEKAGCQLLVTAHEHAFRIDEPNEEHAWTQIVGGGPDTDKKDRHHFPTVIEGEVQNGKLHIRVHDVLHEEVVAELTFDKNRQHTQKPR